MNNRYEHQLKVFSPNKGDKRESSKEKSDCRSRVTTLATGIDQNLRSLDWRPRAVLKCAQCLGRLEVQSLQKCPAE